MCYCRIYYIQCVVYVVIVFFVPILIIYYDVHIYIDTLMDNNLFKDITNFNQYDDHDTQNIEIFTNINDTKCKNENYGKKNDTEHGEKTNTSQYDNDNDDNNDHNDNDKSIIKTITDKCKSVMNRSDNKSTIISMLNSSLSSSSKKKIFIKFYDDDIITFEIHNINKQLIGIFKPIHIIKYISSYYDRDNYFLPHIEGKSYDDAVYIIEAFICKFDGNDFDIYSYEDSPFMGDLESIIKLNNYFHEYEKNSLDDDFKSNHNIKSSICDFIYLLLNYTLQLLCVVSNNIKNENNPNKTLKTNMLYYTLRIMTRINKHVNKNIDLLSDKNKELKMQLQEFDKVKNINSSKINELISIIQKQNDHLQKMAINGNENLSIK